MISCAHGWRVMPLQRAELFTTTQHKILDLYRIGILEYMSI